MIPLDDYSVSTGGEDDHPTPSSLLLPRQGSFKSQSSTCLQNIEPITTPSPPIWSKITDQTPLTRIEILDFKTKKTSLEASSPLKDNKGVKRLERMESQTHKEMKLRLQELESEKEEQLSPLGRKLIVFVGVSLLFLSVLLVGVTLRLGPIIDEMAKMSTNIQNTETNKLIQVPNIVLPPDIQFIDEFPNQPNILLLSPHVRHGSLTSKPSNSSKRKKLCRHHSDSSSRITRIIKEPKSQTSITRNHSTRRNSRRVKRSASAVERKSQDERPNVRRSVSERSSNKPRRYLAPPLQDGSPRDIFLVDRSDANSFCKCSRTSSTKTVVSKASLSELMAIEMGTRTMPGLTAKEARRRRIVCAVALVSFTILMVCILLVAVTLLLSPVVDDVLRKENEELYRSMSSGTTGAPVPNGSNVVDNATMVTSGQPG